MYSSDHTETTQILWFYSKDEAANCNADITNNNSKSFGCKAKLLGNTVAQPTPNQANKILKKCNNCCAIKIINFWRSIKMLPINCEIELKLKWTKFCVSFAAGSGNTVADLNNIIFTMKDTKLYACCNFISK